MKKYVIVLQIKLTEKAVYVFYQITIITILQTKDLLGYRYGTYCLKPLIKR